MIWGRTSTLIIYTAFLHTPRRKSRLACDFGPTTPYFAAPLWGPPPPRFAPPVFVPSYYSLLSVCPQIVSNPNHLPPNLPNSAPVFPSPLYFFFCVFVSSFLQFFLVLALNLNRLLPCIHHSLETLHELLMHARGLVQRQLHS